MPTDPRLDTLKMQAARQGIVALNVFTIQALNSLSPPIQFRHSLTYLNFILKEAFFQPEKLYKIMNLSKKSTYYRPISDFLKEKYQILP